MIVSQAQLKATTKSLVALAVSAGGLFQVPAVHDALISATHAHPHWAGAIGPAMAIGALLHNPQVQAALGVKRTVEVKTETVAVDPSASGAGGSAGSK